MLPPSALSLLAQIALGAGATATGTEVFAGDLIVSSGATALDTFASGGFDTYVVLSGGTLSGGSIGEGVTLLGYAGSIGGLDVQSGGDADLFGYEGQLTGTGVTVEGSVFFDEGTLTGTQVNAGGVLDVQQGGSVAVGTVVSSGGTLNVVGTDSAGTVLSGGVVDDQAGTEIGLTVSNGGLEILATSGGYATGTIVGSGGGVLVNPGAC